MLCRQALGSAPRAWVLAVWDAAQELPLQSFRSEVSHAAALGLETRFDGESMGFEIASAPAPNQGFLAGHRTRHSGISQGIQRAEAPVLRHQAWPAHGVGAQVGVAPPQLVPLAGRRPLLLPKPLARHACDATWATLRAALSVKPACRHIRAQVAEGWCGSWECCTVRRVQQAARCAPRMQQPRRGSRMLAHGAFHVQCMKLAAGWHLWRGGSGCKSQRQSRPRP